MGGLKTERDQNSSKRVVPYKKKINLRGERKASLVLNRKLKWKRMTLSAALFQFHGKTN